MNKDEIKEFIFSHVFYFPTPTNKALLIKFIDECDNIDITNFNNQYSAWLETNEQRALAEILPKLKEEEDRILSIGLSSIGEHNYVVLPNTVRLNTVVVKSCAVSLYGLITADTQEEILPCIFEDVNVKFGGPIDVKFQGDEYTFHLYPTDVRREDYIERESLKYQQKRFFFYGVNGSYDLSIGKIIGGIFVKDVPEQLIDLLRVNHSLTDPCKIGNLSYVDLGLPSGTKWASCNVGADNPWEFGAYFAWGEVSVKNTYGWDNYKYGKGEKELTKYVGRCSNYAFEGKIDKKVTLDSDDDAAQANMSQNWRTPTVNEFEELLEECIWEKNTNNGVNGYTVIGPNKNSIFLPAAGYKDIVNPEDKDNRNVSGAYLSSEIYDYQVNFAQVLFISDIDHSIEGMSRHVGCSVRGVFIGKN